MSRRTRSLQLSSVDVPQADNLALVRELVEAANRVGINKRALAEFTGFSERHVRYRFEAARVLGLLDTDTGVTSRGLDLITTTAGSPEERTLFRRAIARTKVVVVIAPDLLKGAEPDVGALARALVQRAHLSVSTAGRRARALRSWRRQVMG
jgi:hypothetical protein